MLMIDNIPEDKILFYDIETDSKYAAYCNLKMIGYQLGFGEPQLVDLQSKISMRRFRKLLRDPEVIKVSFNGINFDDIVLMRYGFYVEPKNRHDMFLALKTVAPGLQAFSLKYANFHYLLDPHKPERALERWLISHGFKITDICKAPLDILGEYCKHDVRQTANVFCLLWEIVQKPEHWKVYRDMELAMAEPLHEMIAFAGEWLNVANIKIEIKKINERRKELIPLIHGLSDGQIDNPLSSQQVSQYVHDEDLLELALSKAGNYSVTKEELMEIKRGKSPIADAILEFREISKVKQFYKNHQTAAEYEMRKHRVDDDLREEGEPLPLDYRVSMAAQAHGIDNGVSLGRVAIPKGYYMSGAKTRRFQSSSRFKINFQNQTKRTKKIHLVPHGWLGCWIDSRQIENIVHIWASKDVVRREAYEADPDWNEYVWLCNTIFNTSHSRKELEDTVSPNNSQWSIYKQYKMIKLALNFFMGPAKFAQKSGRLSLQQAYTLFEAVHKACPAIRNIVRIQSKEFEKKGYLKDVFGHIYGKGGSFTLKQITQLVIYLIQGCGTGSVPKAMTIANYNTLHSQDTPNQFWSPSIWHPFKKLHSYGVICGTTHDECAFRISLGLPEKVIVELIKACLFNMEERFSPLFDGMPLRAQLAVSFTNAGEQKELDHKKPDFEEKLINEYIRPAKERYYNRRSKTETEAA
jgi:3'-5' exonuclease